MAEELHIDASIGEGGGQVLRSCLALSVLTGRPLFLERIRAGRKKKGLLRQHLTAALAAAEISAGVIEGAELGSETLKLWPQDVRPGTYHFQIGSAGSTTLVLQTVLPPLMLAAESSTLVIEGGTHNEKAPPFDFLERVFLPLLARMGPKISARVETYGFYPKGGGRLVVDIEPAERLEPLELHRRGKLIDRRVTALLADLPDHIGARMISRFQKRSGWPDRQLSWQAVRSYSPGVVLLAEVRHAELSEMVVGFGRRGLPSEKVADRVFQEMRRHLKQPAPVGEYLADQLIVPMALAGGGGFTARALSLHATTQIELVPRFLDIGIETRETKEGVRVEFG